VGGARIGLLSAPPPSLFFRRRFRLFLACSVLSGCCVGGSSDLHLGSQLLKLLEVLVAGVVATVMWWSEKLFVVAAVFVVFFCVFSCFLFTGSCSWWWFDLDLGMLLILILDFLDLRFGSSKVLIHLCGSRQMQLERVWCIDAPCWR